MPAEDHFPEVRPLGTDDYVEMRSRTWEANAAAWNAYVEGDPFRATVFAAVIDGLRGVLDVSGAPATVLDIGCGNGAFMRQAARALPGTTFVGIDNCFAFTDVEPRPDDGRVTFEHGDIEGSAPAVGDASAAVCLFSLIEMAELDRAVLNIAGALRTGGTAIFVVLDGAVELARYFRYKFRDERSRLYAVRDELLLAAHFHRGGVSSPEPYFGFLRPLDRYLGAAERAGLRLNGVQATGAPGLAAQNNEPRAVLLTYQRAGPPA